MSWGDHDRATVFALGSRLVDDAKAYAKAEIDVAKQTGLCYVRGARAGAILLAAAVLLLLAALPVLIAAIGMTLAIWIGIPAGLLVAAMLAILVAGLLTWAAIRSFGAIGEKAK